MRFISEADAQAIRAQRLNTDLEVHHDFTETVVDLGGSYVTRGRCRLRPDGANARDRGRGLADV